MRMNKGANKKSKSLAASKAKTQTAAAEAKMLFLTTSLDMGWRLAVMVLLPVAIGSWADTKFKTSPLWVLVSLGVALVGSIGIIRTTIQQVNNIQAAKGTSKL